MNHRDVLQLTIEAEEEWLKHLQEKVGVDTSGYPGADVFYPELGRTYHRTYFPDALKKQFVQWFEQDFMPRHVQVRQALVFEESKPGQRQMRYKSVLERKPRKKRKA